ncbi:MAG: alpha/beta hydrolase [Sedimentisphaerales bacterium]|nr:alpha/beta hydrolase [Sedimentisphaerales bacterium]
MNKKCVVTIAAALVSITFLSNITFAAQRDISGIWMGTTKISTGDIRIVFNIAKDENGSLTVTMDSPDQLAKGIPVNKVTFENNKLLLDIQLIRGTYEGTLKLDGTFDGHLKQDSVSMPLVLKRVDKVERKVRPQKPKKPYPYIEEEVAIQNDKANIKLAGTLTIPRSDKRCPAVILISGSGAEDRDETVFEHKPFLILADYLTRNGIAVLRVDDRGVGGSTGDTMSSTSEDFAGDVICEMDYLKTRKEIDSSKIGLIGHSEGGTIAPIAANKSKDIAFIVMMAGTGINGEETLYLQVKLLLKNAGASDEIFAKELEFMKNEYDVLKNESDEKVLEGKIREMLLGRLANNSDLVESEMKKVTNPWFRFFLTYDPKPALMKVKCPVLALNGSLDMQVAPKENLAAIESALKEGGNQNYTIKEFPGLNHLFQTAKTGSVTEYALIEETISPDALEMICDWILLQTK